MIANWSSQHDFPDSKCKIILTKLKDAMSKRSLILIDEMMLPNVGVDWSATHSDLTMMASLASKERTQEQWECLLDCVGLKIVAVRKYEGGWGGYEGLMSVAKKG
jgi:demethylsterigmatocystin 6-O-methyltransferase